MKELENIINNLKGADSNAVEKEQTRQDNLLKPKGSLGTLEKISIKLAGITGKINNVKTLETNEKFMIKQQRDFKNGLTYVMLSGSLDNGYKLYMRIPITSIQDSVKISNNFLILILLNYSLLVEAY